MKIILIEEAALQELFEIIKSFHEKINLLQMKIGIIDDNTWLDNQDACTKLNVRKQTLYNMRVNGLLKHTRIGSKMYYKMSDIDDILNKKGNTYNLNK